MITCRRVDISVSSKQDLCLFKEHNPRVAQADILLNFSKESGVTLRRSTVSDIIKNKAN